MTDQVDGKGSSRPNSASDGPAEFAYAALAQTSPVTSKWKRIVAEGLQSEYRSPWGASASAPLLLARLLPNEFLGGVAGAVVFLWLRAQPAFQRLVEGLPTWP